MGMFIRETPRCGKVRVQIVESYRQPGRRNPAKRVVCSVGTATPGPALDAMLFAAQVMIEDMKQEQHPVLLPTDVLAATVIAHRQRPQRRKRQTPVIVENLEPTGSLTLGVHEVFGPRFDQAGYGTLFNPRQHRTAARFRESVLLRLVYPGISKRAQLRRSQRHAPNRLTVQHVYRMMDQLTAPRIQRLQEITAARSRALLPAAATEVLFFDATTLRFTSTQPDALRRKGYSKDGQPHRVQVVVAVIMGAQGLPLGYHVFPGNTADVATMQPAFDQVRAEWGGTRMVVVADAGMLSHDNLQALTAANIDYIVAARIRSLPAAVVAEITDRQNYVETGPAADRLLDTTVAGRRLVMRYDPVRARKQAHDRKDAVDRARKQIAAGRGAAGTGRYIRWDGPARPQLHQAKIERDARFDGLHGVYTSLTDVDAATVRARYHDLWLIEHGFRVLKHDLAIRPVFHWTPHRVQAHIAICFTAFALLRQLMHQLRARRPRLGPISEARLLEELQAIQAHTYVDSQSRVRFMVPAAPTAFQRAVYEVCGLQLPHRGEVIDPPD